MNCSYDYFGESEYAAKIECMQRYHRWWIWYGTIEDPEGGLVLLAEAQGTSAEHEKLRASADGFAEKLDEWWLSSNSVWRLRRSTSGATTLLERKTRTVGKPTMVSEKAIEETDARFKTALSLAELEAPPPSIA